MTVGNLLKLWSARDRRYATRRLDYLRQRVTQRELAIIRDWRLREAAELGDPVAVRMASEVARAWIAPA